MNISQNLSKLKTPVKIALIVAGVIATLAIIILSLAVAERQSRVEAAQDVAASEQAAAADKAEKELIAALQQDNKTLRANNTAVCTYLTGLSLVKTYRPAVVVPAACK